MNYLQRINGAKTPLALQPIGKRLAQEVSKQNNNKKANKKSNKDVPCSCLSQNMRQNFSERLRSYAGLFCTIYPLADIKIEQIVQYIATWRSPQLPREPIERRQQYARPLKKAHISRAQPNINRNIEQLRVSNIALCFVFSLFLSLTLSFRTWSASAAASAEARRAALDSHWRKAATLTFPNPDISTFPAFDIAAVRAEKCELVRFSGQFFLNLPARARTAVAPATARARSTSGASSRRASMKGK